VTRPTVLRRVDLDRFFHPSSVAVVGATDREGRPGTGMWRQVNRWAQAAGAAMYPVNPGRTHVDGQECYRSLRDVPDPLDLVVILTDKFDEALDISLERSAGFVVLFAGEFAEVGAQGEERQRALARRLADSATHLLGPNTNLNAFETFRADLSGRAIALISQSGHQGRPIFQGQELGIRLSHWAPTGNEADLESADFIRYFAEQDQVGAIAAYIEGFKDGRTLQLAADHAARAGVPVVIVKVGRTDLGQSWAKSHTGHLAGRDAITDAVFRQYGVIRVEELDELLDTSAMLARNAPPRGTGACILSISGGTNAHIADLAKARGVPLPRLSESTLEQLRNWIPSALRFDNPVDNGGHPIMDERGRKIFDAVIADPEVAVLIVPITGAVPPMTDILAHDLVELQERTDKPICVIWGSPVGTESAYRDVLLNSRVTVFRSFGNCLNAVKNYLDYHRFRSRYVSAWNRGALAVSPIAPATRERLPDRSTLSEFEAKQLLAAYDIRTTRDILCRSADEAVRVAEELGYPVVLKASSPNLAHKSDAGLVVLSVQTEADIRNSFATLTERAEAVLGAADLLDGIVVCEQITGAVEMIVGISHDELFGPVVMLGMGGVAVEIYRDVTFRVPPFDRDEALRMVRELKGLPLLQGFRGRPAMPIELVVDTLMRVQQIAIDLYDELRELDINPLAILPDGVVALDAFATLAHPAAVPYPR
jgi:acetate---CoA ligase (ADP-forming)